MCVCVCVVEYIQVYVCVACSEVFTNLLENTKSIYVSVYLCTSSWVSLDLQRELYIHGKPLIIIITIIFFFILKPQADKRGGRVEVSLSLK